MHNKTTAILMLFFMGVILIPWQLLCTSHPFGHEHHDGPSLCEIRKAYCGEAALWPPMHCKHVELEVDDFQKVTEQEFTLPFFPITTILITSQSDFPEYSCEFISQPDARSNSDPPLELYPLRGPPQV